MVNGMMSSSFFPYLCFYANVSRQGRFIFIAHFSSKTIQSAANEKKKKRHNRRKVADAGLSRRGSSISRSLIRSFRCQSKRDSAPDRSSNHHAEAEGPMGGTKPSIFASNSVKNTVKLQE
ncbi:hypothetical protein AMECASPLE_028192 [Ameca splendens]|uniref:Uncharacterized protein n=1 Tax=Ameca splendens TaxID=208324 RepID=A0ABV1A1V7_9TELE